MVKAFVSWGGVAVLGLAMVFAVPASSGILSAAIVGEAAPYFQGMDVKDKTVRLSDFKGKTVVLEWSNPACPYVQKHYKSGNMQALQKEAVADGVIWLTINSSGQDSKGSLSAKDAMAWLKEEGAAPTAYLLDESGRIGRLYGARTTPHMYVISADGRLVYAGALDDKSSLKDKNIKDANNYIRAALKNIKDGKSVKPAQTEPYGCSVKYGKKSMSQ